MAKSMLDEDIEFVKIMKVTGLTEDELNINNIHITVQHF